MTCPWKKMKNQGAEPQGSNSTSEISLEEQVEEDPQWGWNGMNLANWENWKVQRILHNEPNEHVGGAGRTRRRSRNRLGEAK